MPWTETTRLQYRREGLRFASDTTDAEWALLKPLMPEPPGIGRPRTTDLRAVINAINRRLAKDFEATIPSAEAWIIVASVQLLTRRLARA